jgi:hypothetical protein
LYPRFNAHLYRVYTASPGRLGYSRGNLCHIGE